MAGVLVFVLGPLRVCVDDREVDLGGPRSRALIARLALAGGRPVTVSTLIDDLWGQDVPTDAVNALQSVVSRTRRRLPAGVLDSTPAGYVLHADSVDALQLETFASTGRFAEALDLWRGEALADVMEFPFAPAAAARLEEFRLTAIESSIQTRVRTDPAAIAELAQLTKDHPYRDGFWRLYLTGLAAQGRPNEALAAYERFRTLLAEDLGADPSPELQELHLSLLRGEHGTQRSHPSLPAGLTSFVGRESAIDDLQAALVDHRLVTILGPGGAGKTRLAVETARAVLDRFEDVWLAELAPVTGDDGIIGVVLSAMGLLEVAVLDRPAATHRLDERARLLEAVRDVEGLLLIDNCEHLVEAAATLAEDLLAHAPKLRILTTSREPLRIIGEFGYQLNPLTMPAADSTVGEAMAHSAVQLFVYRAQAVDQSFALTAETLPAVREICVRLDGQPLAIELAAARLRTLTAGQVAARLSDRFRLLTGGSRTALPRHRTLRAVVEWSWDLLDEAERDLAERLAVFPGGVTAESARAVSLAGDHTEELLDSLADKSLLVPVRGDAPRFRMLETLREYGVERLIDRGIVETVREAHLAHFLTIAEAQGMLLRGRGQVAAMSAIDTEQANIMAALRFAVDRGDRSAGARIVGGLAWYWSIRSQHVEAFTWADLVLAVPGRIEPHDEICLQALSITGILARSHFAAGDDAAWRPQVDRILELWDAHRPDHPIVHVVLAAMEFLGVVGDRVLPEPTDIWTRASTNLVRLVLLDNAGRIGESVELIEPTIAEFRGIGDRWGTAMVLSQRATLESLDGRYDEALVTWEEALAMLAELGALEDIDFSSMKVTGLRLALVGEDGLPALRRDIEAGVEIAQRSGNRRKQLVARMNLASLEHVEGNDAASVEHLEYVLDNVDTTSEFGSGQMEAAIRAGLAVARCGVGDFDLAQQELVTAGRVALDTRDMPIVAEVASAAAVLAHSAGDDERAARLVGIAESIRGRADLMNRDLRRLVETLQENLGLATYEALRADGLALERGEAIGMAFPMLSSGTP